MKKILQIHTIIPAVGWMALYRKKDPPYFFVSEVDLWVACKYVDSADIKSLSESLFKKWMIGRPLDTDEAEIIEANSAEAIFAVCAGEEGYGLGDFDLCADDENFEKVFRKGTLTDTELEYIYKPTSK